MKVLEQEVQIQLLQGVSIKHSLQEDNKYRITEKIMKQFITNGYNKVYVVQQYPDNFIQSSEVISFIGVESDDSKQCDLINQEIELPMTSYVSTTFEPSKTDIDHAYQTVYQELVKQKINVLSNYDVELVDHNNNMTNIMIPKEEKYIQNTNCFTFEEYLELNW